MSVADITSMINNISVKKSTPAEIDAKKTLKKQRYKDIKI
jgi:hypothetical protein